jgi:uncharacterized protein (DUF2252 family)
MSSVAHDRDSVASAYRAFVQPRLSRQQRQEAGRSARASVPLEAHAAIDDPTDGRAPVALLRADEASRQAHLLPVRYERMAASPFAFLRGSAAVMADDLSRLPNSGIRVQLCGDAHLANFGMFASPDRRLVFDLNDFDETLPGPFDWDVKRLAASVVVAGRHVEAKPKRQRRAAAAAAQSYRATMQRLSTMPTLDVWYARVDVDDMVERLRGTSLASDAERAGRSSARNTGDVAVGKLTAVVDGQRRFRSHPPLLVPIREDDVSGITADAAVVYQQYLSTLPADRAALLLRYSFIDLAHKVVGVGSVGTRALVLLMESGDGDALILQLKQAGASVLEPYLGSSTVAHGGERVVLGQRLLQATGDPFLGWARGSERAPFDFYVRQLRDRKGAIDLERLHGDDLVLYARLCGAVLARAHARAGDASTISGYLGDTATFDEAVAEFAVGYADLTETDHADLVAAIARGEIPRSEGP